jgi:hypothetical protein
MHRFHNDDYFATRSRDFQSGLTRFLAFLDARTTGEWIAFVAGIVVGIIL